MHTFPKRMSIDLRESHFLKFSVVYEHHKSVFWIHVYSNKYSTKFSNYKADANRTNTSEPGAACTCVASTGPGILTNRSEPLYDWQCNRPVTTGKLIKGGAYRRDGWGFGGHSHSRCSSLTACVGEEGWISTAPQPLKRRNVLIISIRRPSGGGLRHHEITPTHTGSVNLG